MEENRIVWYSGLTMLDEVAAERGYRVESGSPVLEVPLQLLFLSPAVQKACRSNITGLEVLRLGELEVYQRFEVLEVISSYGINGNDDWLLGFDTDLSNVVIDDEDRIRAILLCSMDEDGILVHLLIGLGSSSAEPFKKLLQGFIDAAWELRESGAVVQMVAVQDSVADLLAHLVGKRVEDAGEIGQVHYIDTEQNAVDGDFIAACDALADLSPIQWNISWKMFMESPQEQAAAVQE